MWDACARRPGGRLRVRHQSFVTGAAMSGGMGALSSLNLKETARDTD